EETLVEGTLHRAPAIAIMSAIAEPASRGDRLDVVEHRVQPGLGRGEPQLAHARRVDDPGATEHREHFPRGRRVTAARIVLADGCREPIALDQARSQRRLAHTGRADERHGPPRPEPGSEPRHQGGIGGVDRHDIRVSRHGTGIVHVGIDVGAEVRLGQDDHRLDTRVESQREVTFESRGIEIRVARGHDEERVQVGGDRLAPMIATRRDTFEQALPGNETKNAIRLVLDQHPIADRQHRRGMHRRWNDDGNRATRGQGHDTAAMNRDDTRGKTGFEILDGQRTGVVGPPAELVEGVSME
ncbi:hypothetical protein KCV01_g17928, partial [Aureobasidium melanogenum]